LVFDGGATGHGAPVEGTPATPPKQPFCEADDTFVESGTQTGRELTDIF
jgi:hypothetical protein